MRIQHNITALSAYRNLTNNNSAVAKNLEKLSSGYKINRAGDDAAGLAISEKMRAQITGLETAQKNANDGISLIQTAEGALTEVHSMLNRMVELANQSANGTYVDDDRVSLQSEVTALLDEIDRISQSTNFNGRTLLNGDLGITKTAADAVAKNLADVSITHVADGASAKEPVKGKFSIDLSEFEVGIKDAQTSVGVGGIKVTIGGAVTISNTTGLTNGGDKITGKDLAIQFIEDIKKGSNGSIDSDLNPGVSDNDNAKITIDGQEFEVTHDGNGKLTFEMINDPTGEFTQDLSVETTVTYTSGGNDTTYNVQNGTSADSTALKDAGVSISQAEQIAVTMDRSPVYAGERIYAQGTFEMGSGKDLEIEDGTALKIGNETYIFAVGEDSKFKGNSNLNIIDMTDFKDSSVTGFYQAASRRLSEAAAGNEMFKVGTDNTTGKVYLTEKDGVDYSKNNLEGSTATDRFDAQDSDWAGLVQFGKGVADAKGASQKGGLTLQIGDTSDAFNQMTVGINDMSAAALGLKGIDISTQDGAKTAVDKIKAAINQVSAQRGDLGALQNRLEHTINSLSVTTENITAAESRIRDVDMAQEMMAYTKNNILVQASQAMLAQANQIPQGVLQLLQ